MKKISLLFAILLHFIICSAQGSLSARYFVMDSIPDAGFRFNDFILQQIPDYKLQSLDSNQSRKNLSFVYENNDAEKLVVRYDYEIIGGDANYKIAGVPAIRKIQITGQWLTMQRVFNRIFEAEINSPKKVYGSVFYNKNAHRYHLIFEPASKEGYWWMMFSWFEK